MPVLPSNYLDESGYPESGFPKMNERVANQTQGGTSSSKKSSMNDEYLGYPESGIPKVNGTLGQSDSSSKKSS
jgi:hypothetical protein